MAVPLGDLRSAIQFRGERTFLQHARIRAEAHRTSLLRDAALFLHEVDHGVRRVFVELGGVGVLPAKHVTGVLDHRALHPEADTEEGDLVLAGVFDRGDLALHASGSEPTRHQDAVDV